MILSNYDQILKLNKKVLYVCYNHRFEPNLNDVKNYISHSEIGKIYNMSFFYGNGTVQDFKKTEWKNKVLEF